MWYNVKLIFVGIWFDGFPGKEGDILKIRKKLNAILSEKTGKSIEEIERDTDRDNWLSADEAKEYGLIDKVIEKRI